MSDEVNMNIEIEKDSFEAIIQFILFIFTFIFFRYITKLVNHKESLKDTLPKCDLSVHQ